MWDVCGVHGIKQEARPLQIHCVPSELSHVLFLSAFPAFFPNFSSHRWWFLILTFSWVCVCSDASVMSDSVWPHGLSLPGSSVRGIFQARILGWVTIPSSRDLPDPGIEPASSVSPALQANSLPLAHRKSPSFFLYISIYQCSSLLPKVIPITCPLQADLKELAMSFCVTLSLLYFFIFIGICFCVWFMAFILCFWCILLLVCYLLYVIRYFSIICLVFEILYLIPWSLKSIVIFNICIWTLKKK